MQVREEYSRRKNVYTSDVSPFVTYTSTEHIVLAESSNFSTYFFLEKKGNSRENLQDAIICDRKKYYKELILEASQKNIIKKVL